MCTGWFKRIVSGNEPDFSSDAFQLLTSSVMHVSALILLVLPVFSAERKSRSSPSGGRITSASKDILRRRPRRRSGRSQLYRFLPLRSSWASRMSAILYLSISAERVSGCSINFARRPTRNERPSGEMAARREKEAACQIDCTEEGRRGGRVVAPWEVFIYAGHVARPH